MKINLVEEVYFSFRKDLFGQIKHSYIKTEAADPNLF